MATATGEQRPLMGYLIWQLSLRWRGAVDRALAPLGMTHAQYALLGSLFRLSRSGVRPSQRELAEFSGLDPMYVSKLARTLERGGLLEREPNPADPRAFHLALTERGTTLLNVAFARVGELHEQLLAPLGGPGDARRVELRSVLEALLRHAEGLDGSMPVTTLAAEE